MVGFSVGVFRIGSLILSVLNKITITAHPKTIELYDQNDFIIKFIINNNNDVSIVGDDNHNKPISDKVFTVMNNIYVADRTWSIRFESQELSENEISALISLVIPIFTLVITLLSSAMIKIMLDRFQQNLHTQKTEIKNQFTNYIFHEVRVPLNTIVVGIENLKSVEMSETGKEHLGIIDCSLKQTTHILNDILDISKIENGRFTIRKQYVNVKSLIDTTIYSFQPLAENKNITLTIMIDEPLINKDINLDKYRITQCINNYMSNAFKYTPENGKIDIKITLKGNR